MPVKCPNCDKECKSKQTLALHVAHKHKEEKKEEKKEETEEISREDLGLVDETEKIKEIVKERKYCSDCGTTLKGNEQACPSCKEILE